MLHCLKCGRQYSTDFEICPEDQSPLQADATVGEVTPGDPLIGHTLDEKYRLEARLGIGGMGTVYRALHLLIDRPVAIKVLNQRFVEDEAARTRFRREARAAGRLQHANAVTVTDFGQSSDGYVYIVMELLEGRTLREILAKEAPLDPARSVSLMMQISDAVAAAHEAGIIHRDLKPANVFIVQRADVPSVVKVLDFGIAKLAAESLEDDDRMTLTQVGVMIGTPRYMSPEQCDGVELTPAADVYSLGIILYEMLTGTVPFSGSTPLAIAMKHATEPPRAPRDFVATIPGALEQVVLHALEKRPEDRPANAAEFRAELLERHHGFGHRTVPARTAKVVEVAAHKLTGILRVAQVAHADRQGAVDFARHDCPLDAFELQEEVGRVGNEILPDDGAQVCTEDLLGDRALRCGFDDVIQALHRDFRPLHLANHGGIGERIEKRERLEVDAIGLPCEKERI